MKSINPATGEVMQEYQEYHLKEVDGIIEDAHRAWKEWRTRSFEERSRVLWKAAEILGEKKEQFAKMITKEMGKPIVQSRAEIEKCIWVCEYYAENAKEILEDEQMKSDGSQAFCSLPVSWCCPRCDAVELPLLASLPLPRACFDGGQYRLAQACL
jgi:succinate-semialdehyde dehydrogenase/glutarate-semialdehyde dehydrogenase